MATNVKMFADATTIHHVMLKLADAYVTKVGAESIVRNHAQKASMV